MGYYDDHYRSKGPQKGNRARGLIMGLTGLVLGALLVIFATDVGLFSGDLQPDSKEAANGDNGEVTTTETVNVVDVNTAITEAVAKAQDAVVEVVNIQKSSLFEQGNQAGVGSGVIYKKEGGYAYVVTNHHVVEGAAQVEITLSNGTQLQADLLGSDPIMDLAVLRVKGDKINAVAEFGSSSKLKPGEPAIAIGNPLGNFPGTVTKGIVSAADRTVPIDQNGDGRPDWQAEVIQTDAAINPGNSGGALINIKGQVIGINSMKIAQQAVEGIGFAIPADIARPIIADLEEFGEVKRPYMGVKILPLVQVSNYHREQTLKIPDDVNKGVVLFEVDPLSPAGKAGLQEFDVIVALDGKEIASPAELRKHLYKEKQIGDKMEVTIYREQEKKTITMTLGEAKGTGE
ncbi:S1C family serine protease [Alkalihalobacillus sp. AL-G]|uniref:S1C family serine protease n=1 Tax=Alkalihalobacillus sp. AL-G TaxID=2926399 RepID=UPI00272B6889|nr:trypsin-like peptidase domain-containing protein [Alkalihalobacillus sp. AL-G]WLD93363.1 trypsin-like peptidase domain-containing protein [Alkalihalobacillus sp. AL-G]